MESEKLLYTNCWEDADILLEALNPGKNDRILSIGSAGDNSFSLLSKSPEVVIVYDVWKPQLYLIELKKAAFLALENEDFLAFLGFRESGKRLAVYNENIRPLLPVEASIYWNKYKHILEKGVIHCGRLEHYFSLFRRFILPVVASKKDVERFFAGPKQAADFEDYRRRLANPLFHVLLKLFLSEPVLKATGRQPAFFKEVKLSLSKYLFDKLSAFILNPNSHQNHYMYYAANGQFGNGLPHYARKENFEVIKANLDRLVLRHGRLEAGIVAEPDTTLINASDIFEYITSSEFLLFGEKLSSPKLRLQRIAYWNFVVDRVLSQACPANIYLETDLSVALSAQDKVYFYKRFVVETKIGN
jgi:S-adenosylmethionine-diacylglycerol 3-amino-3-carboxypropyl transferase